MQYTWPKPALSKEGQIPSNIRPVKKIKTTSSSKLAF